MRKNTLSVENRMKTTPLAVNRTTRSQSHAILTSMPAGKMVPLAAIPLLREDSLAGGQFQLGFEMMETVEILMNPVFCRVTAYLVPKLALERYDGLDSLNKSYAGIPPMEGQPVVPWFEPMVAPVHGANEIFTYMGKHFKPGDAINAEYIEAYNAIWNFRARNRSPDLTLRGRLDTTLAPAFWLHSQFKHIVPDFDQAIIDGEVALNVVNSKMPVRGLGTFGTPQSPITTPTIRESSGSSEVYPFGWAVQGAGTLSGTGTNLVVKAGTDAAGGYPDVWAELQDNGITVSLSNIDMARKTQAFANLRRQYNGHTDEYIIDMLMDGISIPEQAWKQPILLYDDMVNFGMSKRYASDSGNLTDSVVNGATGLEIRLNVPRCPTGGVIMIMCEVQPEQLFERQQDPYLYAREVDDVPQYIRDEMDPEKVVIVENREIDIDHDAPTETFGYAPLNWEWAKSMSQIGGKFYRPLVDAGFDEDRQRLWAVETQNPTLGPDFYLVTEMHLKPFVDQVSDPFEVLMRGQTVIRGNTVFGGMLVEATNDYAKIGERIPTERIDKNA